MRRPSTLRKITRLLDARIPSCYGTVMKSADQKAPTESLVVAHLVDMYAKSSTLKDSECDVHTLSLFATIHISYLICTMTITITIIIIIIKPKRFSSDSRFCINLPIRLPFFLFLIRNLQILSTSPTLLSLLQLPIPIADLHRGLSSTSLISFGSPWIRAIWPPVAGKNYDPPIPGIV